MAARRKATKKKTTKKKAAKKAPRKPRATISETRKKGRGRPPFKPSAEQRQLVEACVGYGLTYKEICVLVKNPTTNAGISTNTLERHFREELDSGAPKVKAKVIGSLVRSACAGNVTAQIWFTKARLGWKGDHITHEVEGAQGVLVAPAGMTPEEWISRAQERNKTKEPPADD